MIDSYKIVEAAKDARHPGDVAYFVVEFYEGGKLVLVEDFQMPHLKQTASLPATDAGGNYMLIGGGTLTLQEIQDARVGYAAAIRGAADAATYAAARAQFLDPIDAKWKQVQLKTVTLDVASQVRENIERYARTAGAKGVGGDRRDPKIRPADKQASGISQLPGVLAAKNVSVAVAAVAEPLDEVKL